jgi:cytochrome c553
MRHFIWLLIPALLSVAAIGAEPPQQAAPAQNGENHPAWAFPVPDATQPEGAEVAGPRKLPDSTKSYTQKEIDDLGNPPDWYPSEHGDVPKIVSSGAANKGFACASCTSEDDAKAAAEWFASLKIGVWVKVTEAAMVPKTFVNGGRMRLPLPAGGTEPIGNRIIEVPQDPAKGTARDPHTGFIAYVPPGSIAKGEAIATTGGGKTISCTVCHGDGLKGFGDIPKLAGLHPLYIARQLFNFKAGTGKAAQAMQMEKVVENLTPDDILNLAAYAASQVP